MLLWRAGTTENKMRELECTGAAYRPSGIDEVGSIHCLSLLCFHCHSAPFSA